MLIKRLVALVALLALVVPLASTAAEAAPLATGVSVTIAGNDSPYGGVASSRRVCKANVTVRVYKQVGTRGGGDDSLVGSDTTGRSTTGWSWSIGNPGLEDGDRVYAKVRAHDGCKVAFSRTMKVDKS